MKSTENALRRDLAANFEPASSCAGGTSGYSSVESICLAILALRRQADFHRFRLLGQLLALQNRDGSWPAFFGDDRIGGWTTALTALSLIAVDGTDAHLSRAIGWLADARGRESHWFWRWRFRTLDRSVKFDPAKYGWSWVSGTTSWVIPTAFSLIALQQVSGRRLSQPPGLRERISLGVSMLCDRMCPGGGWNAGNGTAFGVAYTPYIDATAIALLALQGYAPDVVQASLSWLAVRIRDCRSPYSLSWGILALATYHNETEFSDALVRASNALLAVIEKNGSPLDKTTVAICVLALQALDGDNVFTVRA